MKDQQLSIPSSAGTKAVAKKVTRRRRRRAEKRDPENALGKPRYRGYT